MEIYIVQPGTGTGRGTIKLEHKLPSYRRRRHAVLPARVNFRS